MSKNLHIRDVPDHVHETLTQRAKGRGMSLRGYVLEVLGEHTRKPSREEWFERIGSRPPITTKMSAAQAVREAREERDREIDAALSRS